MGVKISELIESSSITSNDYIVIDNGQETKKFLAENLTDDIEADITQINSKLNGYTLWVGTQAQYDAIDTKSATTIYHILES